MGFLDGRELRVEHGASTAGWCRCGHGGRSTAVGLVRAVSWSGHLDFIPQFLFPVWDAVGEDDAQRFIEEIAAFGGTADV